MEDNKHYLYLHKNPKTNEIFYVGIGVRYRYKETKTNRNQHYLNYVAKYGYPNIEIPHKDLTYFEACIIEKFYIQTYGRVGYEKYGVLVNKGLGGEAGARGSKHSEEWKKNHSKAMTKASNTDKFRARTREVHSGKIVSEETRELISVAIKANKVRGEKIKKTLSDPKVSKARGNAISKGRMKPILQFDIRGVLINEYSSLSEAAFRLNIKGINNVVNKLDKTAGGYKWKYK